MDVVPTSQHSMLRKEKTKQNKTSCRAKGSVHLRRGNGGEHLDGGKVDIGLGVPNKLIYLVIVTALR